MMLAFYAKPGHNCYPAGPRFVGQVNNYIGQRYVAHEGAAAALEHRKEPAMFDSETPGGVRAAKHCAEGGLWPADQETAAYCRVPFVPVEYRDHQWQQAKPKVEKAEAKSPRKDS